MSIVDGKEVLLPNKPAMLSILAGCKTASDVVTKKSDFYYKLGKCGIIECDTIEFYNEENREFNLSDAKTLEVISKSLNVAASEIDGNLMFLNYINILRKDSKLENFENIRHILLTGNSTTIKVAFHDQIRKESIVPLATTLSWITNRFWFKLNKGFGDGNFPISFDIITKSQIVLSTILNRSIGEQYDIIRSEFKEGKVTEEQAILRYVDLRTRTRKPEEIELDDITPILDGLSDDTFEKFLKNYEQSKIVAIKQGEENIKLKEELSDNKIALEKEETARIEAQKEVVFISKSRLDEKKDIFNTLETQKNTLDKIANDRFIVYKILLIFVAAVLCGIPIFVIFKFGWDLVDRAIKMLSVLSPLLLVLYLLVFDKEWTWNTRLFLEKKKAHYKEKTYQKVNFDVGLLEKLKNEIDEVENTKLKK